MNTFLPKEYEPPRYKKYDEMTEVEKQMYENNVVNYILKSPTTSKNRKFKIFKAREIGMMNEFDEKYDSNRYCY